MRYFLATCLALCLGASAFSSGCSSGSATPGGSDANLPLDGGSLSEITDASLSDSALVVDSAGAPEGEAGSDALLNEAGGDGTLPNLNDASAIDAASAADADGSIAKADASIPDAHASAVDAASDGEAGSDLPLDPGFPATANADWLDTSELVSSTFSTAGPNRLLVAIVIWAAGQQDWGSVIVSGGGIPWTDVTDATFPAGQFPPPGAAGVSIWSANAPSALSGAAVTATRVPPPDDGGEEDDGAADSTTWTLAVYAFSAASGTGATATSVGYYTGNDWPVDVALSPEQAGSWVVGGFVAGSIDDVTNPPQPLANTVWDVTNNPENNPYSHFTAAGHLIGVTSQASQPITIGSSATNLFVLCAAIEVLPSP